MQIQCMDRETKEIVQEKIYKEGWIRFLYETFIGKNIVHFVAKSPFLSKWYGRMQDRPRSKKKIRPFIQEFHVNAEEFIKKPEQFLSFNDFFTRKLKPSARPVDADPETVAMPADGRYRVLRAEHPFEVKGQRFSLEQFLSHKKIFDLFSKSDNYFCSSLPSRLSSLSFSRFWKSRASRTDLWASLLSQYLLRCDGDHPSIGKTKEN